MDSNKPDLDIKTIGKILKEIDDIDLQTASLKEIDSLLQPIFRVFGMSVLDINPNTDLVRARVVDQKPKYFHEITYPRKEFVKKFGRANTIGQSMFYCSAAKNAPFFEIGAKVNDLVVVSHWTTKSKMFLTHIGYTQSNSDELKSKRELHETYKLTSEDDDKNKLNRIIYEYLGKRFSKQIEGLEEFYYKLTFCISNRLLGHIKINGIIYPTIAMNGNVDNIVLKPEYVNENLQLQYVELQQITEVRGDKYSVKTIDNAIDVSADGEIVWLGKQLGWTLAPQQQVTIQEVGSVMKLKDEFGNKQIPIPTSVINLDVTPAKKAFIETFNHTLKLNKEINITTNIEEFVANVAISHDFDNKIKQVVMFIPKCKEPELVISTLLEQLDDYFAESNTLEIIMEENSKHLRVDIRELVFNNNVYIYSDSKVNVDQINASKSLNLHFENIE